MRGFGLSPRSRGSPSAKNPRCTPPRSIPALAGKPRTRRGGRSCDTVYPRARGEASGGLAGGLAGGGLSPRSRGSRGHSERGGPGQGSIPALAGKPPAVDRHPARLRVYPRARGEAPTSRLARSGVCGLSPRSRGSRSCRPANLLPCGSIPALAGKPCCGVPPSRHRGVYPRARGEASPPTARRDASAGLSPRSRGSRRGRQAVGHHQGSIPALAGKPITHSPVARKTLVYPRARGEAVAHVARLRDPRGLSPRSRGSLASTKTDNSRHRSIPALAGKPSGGPAVSDRVGVYPRARGEAFSGLPFVVIR